MRQRWRLRSLADVARILSEESDRLLDEGGFAILDERGQTDTEPAVDGWTAPERRTDWTADKRRTDLTAPDRTTDWTGSNR